jgi:hypothetical protein
MGMSYDVTFHDALIKPERYAELLGPNAYVTPEALAEAALDHVRELLSDSTEPVQDENGILLDGDGFYDSASYSYGRDLRELLAHCEPGAYIHEIDVEDMTGEQWRFLVMPDRSIKTINAEIRFPGMDWPTNLPSLIADARTALDFEGVISPAVVDALAGTLRTLVDALDPEGAAK